MEQTLTLHDRRLLTVTGVTEMGTFDETVVTMDTELGPLTIEGAGMKLKTLSLETGQVAVEGEIGGIFYEAPRPVSLWRRIFG